ncbi:Cytochrome P450 regulator [Dirofilaria immitis]
MIYFGNLILNGMGDGQSEPFDYNDSDTSIDDEYHVINDRLLSRRQLLIDDWRNRRSRSLTPSSSRSQPEFRTPSPSIFRHHIF